MEPDVWFRRLRSAQDLAHVEAAAAKFVQYELEGILCRGEGAASSAPVEDKERLRGGREQQVPTVPGNCQRAVRIRGEEELS